MKIIKALQQRMRNPNMPLTNQELQEALDFMELSILRNKAYSSELAVLRGENCALDLQIKAMTKKDSPLVSRLKWSGRASVLVVSVIAYAGLVGTMRWNAHDWVEFIFIVQILAHSIKEVLEWRKK